MYNRITLHQSQQAKKKKEQEEWLLIQTIRKEQNKNSGWGWIVGLLIGCAIGLIISNLF